MSSASLDFLAHTFPAVSGSSAPDDRLERGKQRLARMRWFVDEAIPVPFFDATIGADTIIGLLPVAGDAVSAAIQSYLLVEALHLGVGRSTLWKMALNVAVDFGIGLIPVIGDLLDARFKATRRNVDLILDDLGAG